MSTEKKAPFRIHGVNIEKAALKNINTLEDLKKTEIFKGLPADQEASGYTQLWGELKPAAVAPSAPASPAPAAKQN